MAQEEPDEIFCPDARTSGLGFRKTEGSLMQRVGIRLRSDGELALRAGEWLDLMVERHHGTFSKGMPADAARPEKQFMEPDAPFWLRCVRRNAWAME